MSGKDDDFCHILLYLRSSVTPVPPFGDPLSVRRSLNSARELDGSTFEASCASFSRI